MGMFFFPNSYGTQSPPENKSCWQRMTSCFSLETYQVYYDVNTEDIKDRLKNSIFEFNRPGVFREKFLHNSTKLPDLYGPYWITLTLIFTLSISSNLFKYFNGSYDDFDYKIHHLVSGTLVVFGVSMVMPLILFLAFTCLSVNMSFTELFAIYGYSLVSYIPASLLCMVPIHIFIWAVLVTATFISVMFVLRNVVGPIMSAEIHRRGSNAAETTAIAAPLLGTVIGAHVIFLLTIKLGFYHF